MKLEFFTPLINGSLPVPYILSKVSAGFPSPADDFIDNKIDINKMLIKHPAATYFIRVTGQSMIDYGIQDGDLLIVDRSLNDINKKIVIVVMAGDFLVKHIYKKNKIFFLSSGNKNYQEIEITEEMDCIIWGVVTYVIHATK
ncbi:MAG: translesion error-prone DNA polymerase V autoproteolytic subunit [Dehalococcoidia bacterium]|jgi:DNA polymerase V|tara:strand:- start:2041 stop:2466 length:426 start_codon:yes stop_codon:yes gene_type:complete